MGLLYKLTFANGKSYIGITAKTMQRRLSLHLHHARKGRECALHRAIRKYGEKSFSTSVLVVAKDWDYLCDLEMKAISAFGTMAPGGYNLTLGGEGVQGVKLTAQQRARMSEIRMGQQLGNKHALGYRHTEEAKKKIAEAGRGSIFSTERRAKIGATKIGNKYCLGKPCSEETRAKISNAQKGRPRFTEDQKRSLSLKRKGRPWTDARRKAQENRASK